ncbi:MAG: VCBS repeat-containing protein [Candidatus Electrothrix sp. AR5]|nr:VCBS repeat-containing protein [Candidatus Electrothrix sp. AR5]
MNSYHCHHFAVRLRTMPSLLFRLYILLTIVFLTIPVTASTTETTGDKQNRGKDKIIIIPPFKVQTRTPHPHLQTGLANILATRVTKRTGHIIAPHSTETDQLTDLLRQQDNGAVQKIIQAMDDTYLLAGTLKEKKQGYEIKIHVFAHRPTAQISLSQTFNQLDRALSVLDELSLDIAERIFSVPRPKKAAVTAETGRLEGFHTAHPERLFKEKKYSLDVTAGSKIKNTDFGIQGTQDIQSIQGIQSSRKDILPSLTVLAMAVGDLNNDGKEEFVILEKANVALYHRDPKGSFQRIAFQPLARHLGLHTMYLADLDNNGLQEIYIGASNGTNPASQILEWDGRRFYVLYQNAPYYLRPAVDAMGRPLLLGQKNALQEIGKTFFTAYKEHLTAH